MRRKCWLLLLVCAVLLNIGSAMADEGFYVIAGGGGVGTKITSLPYNIAAPGFYYLGGNLNTTTGNGIKINSDNVTLDLMGFCLTGTGSYKGISTDAAQENIEVRNGSLKGWNYGVDLSAGTTTGHQIINVRVMGVITGGIRTDSTGAYSLVKGCTVSNVQNDFGIECIIGAVIGNTINNCQTGIRLRAGNIIGNNIYVTDDRIGIKLEGNVASNYILIDQNTVNGGGITPTHFLNPGANTVRFGHNVFLNAPYAG